LEIGISRLSPAHLPQFLLAVSPRPGAEAECAPPSRHPRPNGCHLPSAYPRPSPRRVPLRPRRPRRRRRGVQDRLRLLRQPERAPGARRNTHSTTLAHLDEAVTESFRCVSLSCSPFGTPSWRSTRRCSSGSGTTSTATTSARSRCSGRSARSGPGRTCRGSTPPPRRSCGGDTSLPRRSPGTPASGRGLRSAFLPGRSFVLVLAGDRSLH
jgi:hypothetical protein